MRTPFRIAYNDTIRAYGYNRTNKLVVQLYDSGFTKISQVIGRLSEKSSGLLTRLERVNIVNKDKDTSEWFVRIGEDRWDKER